MDAEIVAMCLRMSALSFRVVTGPVIPFGATGTIILPGLVQRHQEAVNQSLCPSRLIETGLGVLTT